MAAPPNKTELVDVYPNPSTGVFKAGIGKFYDYVKGLLGATGNAAEARSALGAAPIDSPTFTTSARAPTEASTEDSTKIATTAWAKFGFAALFAGVGYIKFPAWLGGFILQWGIVSVACNTANSPSGFYGASLVTFPLAFPNAVLHVFTSVQDGSGQPSSGWQSVSLGGFQAIAKSSASANFNVNFFAVGR